MNVPTPADSHAAEESGAEAGKSTWRVGLHMAPQGFQCGLFSYSWRDFSIRILVIPKLWKSRCPTVVQAGTATRQLTIVAPETERITIEGKEPEWRDVLLRAVGAVEEAAREASEAEDASTADGDRGDDDRDKEELARDRMLLCMCTPRQEGAFRPWDRAPEEEEAPNGRKVLPNHLNALLQLVVRSGYLKFKTRDHSPAERSAGHLVDEGGERSDAFRFLHAHAFVEEMGARRREVRQSYRLRQEWLAGVRGRPTSRGLVHHMATGEPRMECVYDDFTAAIPLFQVVVTALDQVERGRPFPADLAEIAAPIRDKAARLRRELSHIPSLPARQAAHLAGQIRLSRLFDRWKPALHMARLLLNDHPLDLAGKQEGQGALLWTVDTSKVWEKILLQMLNRDTDRQFLEQQEMATPLFEDMERKVPDLTCCETERHWILDAKYKHWTEPGRPSRDEQFQLFGYSHLRLREGATWPSRGVFAGLIYATTAAQAKRSTKVWKRAPLWPKGHEQEEPSVVLGTFVVPFPMPSLEAGEADSARSELTTDAAWKQWVSANGGELRRLLLEAAEEGSPRKASPPHPRQDQVA